MRLCGQADAQALAAKETERVEAAAQLERRMSAMEAVLAARRNPVAEAKPEAARGPGADLRFQASGCTLRILPMFMCSLGYSGHWAASRSGLEGSPGATWQSQAVLCRIPHTEDVPSCQWMTLAFGKQPSKIAWETARSHDPHSKPCA